MRHPRRFGALGLVLAVLGGSLALAACAPAKSVCTEAGHTVTADNTSHLIGGNPRSTDSAQVVGNNQTIDGRFGSINHSDDRLALSILSTDALPDHDDESYSIDELTHVVPITDTTTFNAASGFCWLGGRWTGLSGAAPQDLALNIDPGVGTGSDYVIGDIAVLDEANVDYGIEVRNVDGLNLSGNYLRVGKAPWRLSGVTADFTAENNYVWADTTGECGPIFPTPSQITSRSNPGRVMTSNLMRYDGPCAYLTSYNSGSTVPTPPGSAPFVFNDNYILVAPPSGASSSGSMIAGFPTPAGMGLTTSTCKNNVLMSNSIAIPASVKTLWNASCEGTTFVGPANALNTWNSRSVTWFNTYGTP